MPEKTKYIVDKEQECRDQDLMREAARLRGVSPDKLSRDLDRLNSYIIASAKEGIRMRGNKESLRDLF
jgi:hypothetical protein